MKDIISSSLSLKAMTDSVFFPRFQGPGGVSASATQVKEKRISSIYYPALLFPLTPQLFDFLANVQQIIFN